MLFALTLLACDTYEPVEDPSLEAFTVQTEDAAEASGVLTVTAGAGEGDWVLAVGDTSYTYHSPSRADLSQLDGLTVTIERSGDEGGGDYLRIDGEDGPLFVASTGDDGTTFFGRSVWKRGDIVGRGDIAKPYDEFETVNFTDVVLTDDEGEVLLTIAEPAPVTLDGAAWRVTVLSAYETENLNHSKCPTPPMLAIELLRTDADVGEPIVRADETLHTPLGSCG